MTNYITPVEHKLDTADRAVHYGHNGAVLWLTGLSGSGKTTLSMALEKELMKRGYACYVLDGDNIRHGLNSNLGFSPADRSENIRRVGEVAALFADAGLICISAFISPYRNDRAEARQACAQAFHEIYIAADLATCEQRDPKGLYKKARSGELQDFTGISAPYEVPLSCELTLYTSTENVEQSLSRLVSYVTDSLPLSRTRKS